jgi:hypothetical protein
VTNKLFRHGALLIALFAPAAAQADNSAPTVVTPQTTPAPQTPASPAPPMGTSSPGIAGPAQEIAPGRMGAPNVVAPTKPRR